MSDQCLVTAERMRYSTKDAFSFISFQGLLSMFLPPPNEVATCSRLSLSGRLSFGSHLSFGSRLARIFRIFRRNLSTCLVPLGLLCGVLVPREAAQAQAVNGHWTWKITHSTTTYGVESWTINGIPRPLFEIEEVITTTNGSSSPFSAIVRSNSSVSIVYKYTPTVTFTWARRSPYGPVPPVPEKLNFSYQPSAVAWATDYSSSFVPSLTVSDGRGGEVKETKRINPDEIRSVVTGKYLRSEATGGRTVIQVTLPEVSAKASLTTGVISRFTDMRVHSSTNILDVDNRSVQIDSGSFGAQNFRKSGHPHDPVAQVENVRDPDGAIAVDSVVSWDENLSSYVSLPFVVTSNEVGFSSDIGWPKRKWSKSGGSQVPYPNEPDQLAAGLKTARVRLQLGGSKEKADFTKTTKLTVDVEDKDGVKGANKFDIRWHLPEEDVRADPANPKTTLEWRKNEGASSWTDIRPVPKNVTVTVNPGNLYLAVGAKTGSYLLAGASVLVTVGSEGFLAPTISAALALESMKLSDQAADFEPKTYDRKITYDDWKEAVEKQRAINSGAAGSQNDLPRFPNNPHAVDLDLPPNKRINLTDASNSGQDLIWSGGSYKAKVVLSSPRFKKPILLDLYGPEGFIQVIQGTMEWDGTTHETIQFAE